MVRLLIGWSVDERVQVGAVENGAFDLALDFQARQGRSGSVFDQGYEKESDYSHAYLNHNRIQGGAQEGFDVEVLLDPFEEQLHFPTAFVQSGDGAWRPLEVVGDENVWFAIMGIDVSDSPQTTGVLLLSNRACHPNGLIGSNAQFPVHFPAFDDLIPSIRLQPGDEKSAPLVNRMKELKIGVSPVNQKYAVLLNAIATSHLHVVSLSVGDYKHLWDGVSMVVFHMKLYCPFGLSKLGPIENTQA